MHLGYTTYKEAKLGLWHGIKFVDVVHLVANWFRKIIVPGYRMVQKKNFLALNFLGLCLYVLDFSISFCFKLEFYLQKIREITLGYF